jgi:hypothetical protein
METPPADSDSTVGPDIHADTRQKNLTPPESPRACERKSLTLPSRTSSVSAISPTLPAPGVPVVERYPRSISVPVDRSRVFSMVSPQEHDKLALVQAAVKKFNATPAKGMRALIDANFFNENPPAAADVARFLLMESALLNKKAIGDYLGEAYVSFAVFSASLVRLSERLLEHLSCTCIN